MLRRTILATAIVSAMASASLPANAQTPPPNRVFSLQELPPQVRETAARVLSHWKHVDGATAPQELLLSDLMRRRLAGLTQTTGLDLSAADIQVLSAYAAGEQAALNNIGSDAARRFSALCANRRATGTAVLVSELISMQRDEDEQMQNHYEMVLNALSPAGRKRVLKHLKTHVAPRMNKSTIDLVGLAADMPEQLVAQIEFACTTKPGAPITIKIEGDRRDNPSTFAPFGG